jgi:hypothetical protein
MKLRVVLPGESLVSIFKETQALFACVSFDDFKFRGVILRIDLYL